MGQSTGQYGEGSQQWVGGSNQSAVGQSAVGHWLVGQCAEGTVGNEQRRQSAVRSELGGPVKSEQVGAVSSEQMRHLGQFGEGRGAVSSGGKSLGRQ